MNFAPIWKAVLAGEMDLFQVQALCELHGMNFSQGYFGRKFNRYLDRDNDPRYCGIWRKVPLTVAYADAGDAFAAEHEEIIFKSGF